MTDQVAGAPEVALVNEAQVAVASRRDDRRVEIDQVRVVGRVPLRAADAVRVVARIAGRVFAANMLVVFPKTLVIQDAVLAVAVVAELVGTGAVLRVVGDLVAVDENRLERRAVGPFRSRTAGALCRIRIVAIAAGNDRLLRQRWDEARHVAVGPRRSERMERRVGRLNLQADVGLLVLPLRAGRRFIRAVAVAAQANLVGIDSRIDLDAGEIDATNIRRRVTGDTSRVRRMRIVAIGTLDMPRIDNSGLDRIVDTGVIGDAVAERFGEFRLDIRGGDVSVVACEAVVFLDAVIQQARPTGCQVRLMTIAAGVVTDRRQRAVRPGIGRSAVPGRTRLAVGGLRLAGLQVAARAELRTDVRHDEESAEVVAVRVMAGGALQLGAGFALDARRQRGWRLQLTILGRERARVAKRHGMVVRQVGADEAGSRRHCCYASGHRDIGRLADDLAQRDGAVVAAQAHQRMTGRLARLRDRGRTRIGHVRCGWSIAVPERRCRSRGMRRMAKDADPVLGDCRYIAWPCGRQVVFGIDHAARQCVRKGYYACEQPEYPQTVFHSSAPM